MTDPIDVVLVNPGGRDKIYQELGTDLTAVEPPLWCRLLASYLRHRGYSVRILDSEAENLGPQAVAEAVHRLSPLLVGMVVFGHQPSASTQMMAGAGEACRAIKAVDPARKILILGGHVSALPERTLREEQVDFAAVGEGAQTLQQLIDVLRSPEPEKVDQVAGLAFRREGELVINPMPPLIQDLDRDLPGDTWDLLPMERYRAHNWQCFGELARRIPYASIYTSLGCPYHCSFCCINAPFGKANYRMRSPEAVVAEIEHLYRTYGVRTFKIIDELFVLNDRHVRGICEALIARGFSDELNIWAYARPDTIKPGQLALLRKAGIRWLALGIESGSKKVRDEADKSLKSDDIKGIVEQIQRAGIHIIGNYIFGLPEDDAETMAETLALAKELNTEFVNFYAGMAYPGSRLYETALELQWALPESWSGYSQHSYDARPLPTKHLSAADVLRFRDQAFTEFFTNPRYLDMITQRFGPETRHHLEAMTKHKLRRKLLEQPTMAA
ncbi:MAG TPA: radical SAM protein [Stellaceae bacterium]|nr:radical SAM protein [Stellaceae bacterium]